MSDMDYDKCPALLLTLNPQEWYLITAGCEPNGEPDYDGIETANQLQCEVHALSAELVKCRALLGEVNL